MYKLTSEYFKKCRISSGLTRKEVATALGYNQQFVYNWENSISFVPMDRLCKYLSIIEADKSKTLKLMIKDFENEVRGYL